MASFMVPAAGGTAAVLAGVLVAGGGSGLSSDLALTVVGIIGSVLACVLNVIPVWSFVIPIVKENTIGNRTVYGHAVLMLGCAAWGLYAAPSWPKTWISAVINGSGFVFQLVFVMVFIYHAAGLTRWIALGLLLLALIGSGALTWMVVVKVMIRGEWDISFIAPIASTISCVGYAAVGLDIAAVVRTKDVSNMDPLMEVLLNILYAGTWVYYGYLSSPVDNYIGVPNVLGMVFLAVQLSVYVMHCRAEPEPEPEPAEETSGSEDFGSDLVRFFATPSPHADVLSGSEDFGADLVLFFATPSPHADVPEPDTHASTGSEIEVVVAPPV